MAAFPITSIKGGINRYLVKAGAKADTLFDAVNCDVTITGRARPRYGTVLHSRAAETTVYRLPPGTKGLTTYKDKLVVFSDQQIDLSAYPDYQCEILTYPGATEIDDPPTLQRINFAEPFLGYLYISATWSDGQTFHYWLQEVKVWEPNKVYLFNDLVRPTIPNGFTYRANRLNPAGALWRPNTAYDMGDVVEPTTPTSFDYEVVDTVGINPRSGPTEPKWGTTPGALTNDDAEIDPTDPDETGGDGTTNQPPQDVKDRYGEGPDAPTSGRGAT